MESVNDKSSVKKSEKSDNFEKSQSQLSVSLYQDMSALKPAASSSKDASAGKYLPDVIIADLDAKANSALDKAGKLLIDQSVISKAQSLAQAINLLGHQSINDLSRAGSVPEVPGRGASSIPRDGRRSDPRTANGSPGWNDPSQIPADTPDTSLLGRLKDALKPDYSGGENLGHHPSVRDPLANPPRDFGPTRFDEPETLSPSIPVSDIARGAADYLRNRAREQQKADDRSKKNDEPVQNSKEPKDSKEPREAREQKQQDDDKKKQEESKQSDDDKKKKDKDGNSGRPNPDAEDRPSAAEVAAAAAQARDSGLTNPRGPAAEVAVPTFGAVRNKDFVTNPNPNNEGNNGIRTGSGGGSAAGSIGSIKDGFKPVPPLPRS